MITAMSAHRLKVRPVRRSHSRHHTGRVDTDQSRRRCRDPIDEFQHRPLVRCDVGIVSDLLWTDVSAQNESSRLAGGEVAVTRCIASDEPPGIRSTAVTDSAPAVLATHSSATAGGAARCNARVASPSSLS